MKRDYSESEPDRIEAMLEEIKKHFDILKPGAVIHKCVGCGAKVGLTEKADSDIWCSISCFAKNATARL